MVVTTIIFAHTTFLWATCCLICFIPIVKPFLAHWSWLRFVHVIQNRNRTHCGCDQSTRDAYSSIAPDPISDIFRCPCTPIFWFEFPEKRTYEIDYCSLFLSFHKLVLEIEHQRCVNMPCRLILQQWRSWSSIPLHTLDLLIYCWFDVVTRARFRRRFPVPNPFPP
jgi:hypothetical protein